MEKKGIDGVGREEIERGGSGGRGGKGREGRECEEYKVVHFHTCQPSEKCSLILEAIFLVFQK